MSIWLRPTQCIRMLRKVLLCGTSLRKQQRSAKPCSATVTFRHFEVLWLWVPQRDGAAGCVTPHRQHARGTVPKQCPALGLVLVLGLAGRYAEIQFPPSIWHALDLKGPTPSLGTSAWWLLCSFRPPLPLQLITPDRSGSGDGAASSPFAVPSWSSPPPARCTPL